MNATADRRLGPASRGRRHPLPRTLTLVALATGAWGLACTGNIPGGGSGSGGKTDVASGDNGRGGGSSNSSTGGSSTGGGSTGPGGSAATPPAPQGLDASVAPLRRLNAEQYRNTVQDLLGLGSLATDAMLPADESISGERFISNVVRPVQGADVDRYADLAEAIARQAVTNLMPLLGCDPSGSNEDSCIGGFITNFGLRAFRRPLTQPEIDKAKALYTVGRTGADVSNGVRLLLQGMLQAPSFLYLVEPAPLDQAGKVVAVDNWAMASRLSYFLLDSTPDTQLLQAAKDGKLATPDQVAAQAQRLMGSDQFRAMVSSFHSQWLETEDLTSIDKDPMLFPAWNDQLRAALLEEPRRFADYVMHDGDGTLKSLLTASYSVLNGPLSDLYGVAKPAGAAPDAWAKADLDPKQRAGLFTQGGIMASLAKPDRTSFIRRGRVVREALLCTPIPDPPPGVDASEANIPATVDARTRAAMHRDKPACSGCHALFDPLGFAFEEYDAIGRFRTTENGKAIDTSTDITATAALNGSVKDAVDMMGKLGEGDEVRGCVAKLWMRFALGRDDVDDDKPSLDEAVTGFKAGGWKVNDLLMALAKSDSFRYQKVKP